MTYLTIALTGVIVALVVVLLFQIATRRETEGIMANKSILLDQERARSAALESEADGITDNLLDAEGVIEAVNAIAKGLGKQAGREDIARRAAAVEMEQLGRIFGCYAEMPIDWREGFGKSVEALLFCAGYELAREVHPVFEISPEAIDGNDPRFGHLKVGTIVDRPDGVVWRRVKTDGKISWERIDIPVRKFSTNADMYGRGYRTAEERA